MNAPVVPGCVSRSGLNWLLHRAAQKLGSVAQEAAGRHGITTRGQLVLTALASEECRRTQLALGQALGLDKTTLTAELDRLERAELIVRKPDPTDRRVRVPAITERGRAVQAEVEKLHVEVESAFTAGLEPADVHTLRALLQRLIVSDSGSDSGSCI
ncbi:DNA-binding MarR family transcriptional regulator [Saccharothrix tamanrassetensis]|uniref:DNA-binding MarR family transcriptional regulator n=1 Tax=Saccharothrix tamanrassetensis TaxID=1051531 RepID=A0A841CML0_9PSEU|nr:MarR family transcriptional regulator [Saccharothrix tamanrassetensis]MBB5957604.1 DNA-binding MarR family transcriptional regulator [Saccharothrix tamanrassetensis]